MSEVIRAAAKKWFYESFDCDLLERMERAGLIAQAEGFSISVMAELELEMESAFHSELAALREELARVKGLDHNQLLAESAAQHLIKRGAENYTGEVFTIQLDDSTTKFEVVVSTQKVGAITVYERLADAERRNAESSAALQLATRLLASGLSALNPRAGLAKNVRAFLDSQRKHTESGASE